MQKQQDTEIASLHTKNTLPAHSAKNATSECGNHEANSCAHKKQLRALSEKKTAELGSVRVAYESRMKHQNQIMECELVVAQSEARKNWTLNSEPEKLFSTSR